ncbi:unnamed protein product, partial [Symbiodinium pilosum]
DAEKQASVDPEIKRPRFSKLDLTALIISKGLRTKAAILAYMQEHGSYEAQVLVHSNQKKLKNFLDEAAEWHSRPSRCTARAGDGLESNAVNTFFAANQATISKFDLAVALRAIICKGPSKTTRVPLVAGPTNSGKTTLFLPFDEVFGFQHVFHKPALGSKFALRNILKDKRFLFFDDFRPVEYGQETLPVSTFLSLFQGQPLEVQVSQAFHDGNMDFEWRRGCIMTAKAEGLWIPRGAVSQEDIRHMQSRVLMFSATATVPNLRDTVPCARCLCFWIRELAAQHDTRLVLQAPPSPSHYAIEVPDMRRSESITGLAALAERAKLPAHKIDQIRAELEALGAIHIAELTAADWQSLSCWPTLLPFEQRRLLASRS